MILIIMGLCAVPIFILGLFIKKGKGLMLLAGYNTMPKEKRNKIDKKELSKTAGNLMLRMALELALLGVTLYSGLSWATVVLLVIIIADPCICAVRMSGKMPKAAVSKKSRAIIISITVIVGVAVCFMFYYGEKEPVVRILDNKIQVEAMYGLDINFSDITAISLIEKSMKDIGGGRRINGYGGFGETQKGYFNNNNLGDYLLFVKSGSSPTIYIRRDSKEDIYISFSDGEKTKTLYQELTAADEQRNSNGQID